MTSVVIIGGGPGGYEAAHVARSLGGEVTLIERRGIGGAAVLTDVVPSKSLIATAQFMKRMRHADLLGVRTLDGGRAIRDAFTVDITAINERIRSLAAEQSEDIRASLVEIGVSLLNGSGSLKDRHTVHFQGADGSKRLIGADIILVATGATPRELDTAKPDGERIFSWTQLYEMTSLPEHLIVVGSGVTGAEFASAYRALGAEVTLISSRAQVLPGEDNDAAALIQESFTTRGIRVLNNARAQAAEADATGVSVTLADGQIVRGSHCLMAVGGIPNTAHMGLESVGVDMTPSGHIVVDRVSRTSVRGIYAAGDCTNGFALASVAAMQGRLAMRHSLGDAVMTLNARTVSANVFTMPEIATVGIGQKDIDEGRLRAHSMMLSLHGNARSKMANAPEGFVKLFCLPTTHIVVGGVIVSDIASELIYSVSLAVRQKLTVEQMTEAFAVYPSLSGTISEAARRLRGHDEGDVVLY